MNGDKKISELPLASNLGLDDLLAVVHDGVTSKVSLRSLISELQVTIPQPRIKIRHIFPKDLATSVDEYILHKHDMVYAFWEGDDDKFLKYNPKFFLYRYKKADVKIVQNNVTGVRRTVLMKKRFVHPSHAHGKDYMVNVGSVIQGSPYFAGVQSANSHGIVTQIAPRNTEWALNPKPMLETHLDLAPWSYFRIPKGNRPGGPIKRVSGGSTNDQFSLIDKDEELGPDSFPSEFQPIPRGTGSKKSRFIVFKVRIAIDNPNPDSKMPKLFGPFSETFILYPHKEKSAWTNLRYFLGPEASPRLRSKV